AQEKKVEETPVTGRGAARGRSEINLKRLVNELSVDTFSEKPFDLEIEETELPGLGIVSSPEGIKAKNSEDFKLDNSKKFEMKLEPAPKTAEIKKEEELPAPEFTKP